MALAGIACHGHFAFMTDGLTVLGIETSCDETAVAVVGDG